MKTYLKSILLFLTLTILLIVSCSEEEPLYMTSTPIAHAGIDQLVEIYHIVNLDGSLSTKSENVEYIWTFSYKPPGSITVFSDSSAPNPSFVADLPGFYNVQLVVKNKEMYSEPDFVVIQAILTKSESYFPQNVGNKWKYKVTDEEGTVKDTVTIEVVGTTTLQNGESASIWVYSGDYRMWPYGLFDTLYLATRGDTLVYYQFWQNDLMPFLGYIIPFQVGNKWTSLWLNAYTGVTVLEKVGNGAYRMEHRIQYTEGYDKSYNWIAPYVGLVKMDLYSEYFMPYYYREGHWELIWYNLVE